MLVIIIIITQALTSHHRQ